MKVYLKGQGHYSIFTAVLATNESHKKNPNYIDKQGLLLATANDHLFNRPLKGLMALLESGKTVDATVFASALAKGQYQGQSYSFVNESNEKPSDYWNPSVWAVAGNELKGYEVITEEEADQIELDYASKNSKYSGN